MTTDPMTPGDGLLGGPDLPADALDLIAALRRHLVTHPDDAHTLGELRRAALDGQHAHDMRPLEPLTWSTAPPPQPRQWVIDGWLPLNAITILAGSGGIGKSRLALQLAAGVASGGDLDRWIGGWTASDYTTLALGNGVPEHGGPVLYVTWEDAPDECFRRLAELSGLAAPWVTPERLEDLYIVDMAGRGPAWGPNIGQHIQTAAGLLPAGQQLRDLAEKLGAILVILDPLAAAYAADENARPLVRAFMSDWHSWARAHSVAVLLLSHPPKSGADYAGSTDWQAASRAMWRLDHAAIGKQKGAESGWRLELVKSNSGRIAPALRLEWNTSGGGLRWEVADPWETGSQDQAATSSNEEVDVRKRYAKAF